VAVDRLAKNLESYLSEVTGLKVGASPMEAVDLPYFFTHQYVLYRLQVGGTVFMAVFLRQSDDFKPAQFLKHLRQVPSIDEAEVCVVAQALPSYLRKRLMEKRIAFVVPGSQMYLPALGMELRSRPERNRPVSVEKYSPAAQVVVIHGLLGRMEAPTTPLALSKQMGYSAMSMSRAFDELEATHAGKIERIGKERVLLFPKNRRTLWERLKPRLRDPVQKQVYVFLHDIQRLELLPAGISALSAYSMLAEPVHPEFAVGRMAWKEMKQSWIETIPVQDEGTGLIQVWRYDPRVLATEGRVDPFSLYMSLCDEEDERIEMALEEMMERYL
jgi:hypothetical protein